jgi:hypothetical protein
MAALKLEKRVGDRQLKESSSKHKAVPSKALDGSALCLKSESQIKRI